MNGHMIDRPGLRDVRQDAGYTLIELIITTAIIAILAGVAVPLYRDYLDRARSTAFLVQLDAWRSKAAIEAKAFGADLCHWDDARHGAMRDTIFGGSAGHAVNFQDFTAEVMPRDPGTGSAGAFRPFVVDVLATASDGPHALNVTRLLREELDRVGLRHVSPATDRDLPSVQSFSALLGDCASGSGSGGSGHVQQGPGGVVAAVVSPTPSSTPTPVTGQTERQPLPLRERTAGSPKPVASGAVGTMEPAASAVQPAATIGTAPVPTQVPPPVAAATPGSAPPSSGTDNSAASAVGTGGAPAGQAAAAHAPPGQASADGHPPGSTGGGSPLPIPTPSCSHGQVWQPAQHRCGCSVGHWNAHQQRCVGNNVNGNHHPGQQ